VQGIVDGERPELLISSFRPVDRCVEHESPGAFHDCFYSSLSYTILMMGSDSAELEPLTFGIELTKKFGRIKDAIVAVISLDADSMGMAVAFEGHFGANGVVCA
jgi:hypothetical protein